MLILHTKGKRPYFYESIQKFLAGCVGDDDVDFPASEGAGKPTRIAGHHGVGGRQVISGEPRWIDHSSVFRFMWFSLPLMKKIYPHSADSDGTVIRSVMAINDGDMVKIRGVRDEPPFLLEFAYGTFPVCFAGFDISARTVPFILADISCLSPQQYFVATDGKDDSCFTEVSVGFHGAPFLKNYNYYILFAI